MKKIKAGIITQARMGSSRLPGKIMLEVKNKPMLQYHIERLQESGIPVFIATTTNPADDAIELFAQKHNISYFRGSESDVLARYYECAKENNLDVIIRATSDSTLNDGTMAKKQLEEYLDFNDENIYYSPNIERTYPHGANFEIFSFKLLEDAYKKATEPFDREHVTPYIIQNKSGNVILKHFKRSGDASAYRITLDYPEDFLLIKELIEKFDAQNKTMEEIIKIYEENPRLVEINIPEQMVVWGDGTKDNLKKKNIDL